MRVLDGEEIRHDEVEGVGGLGWVAGGRLVSGGGSVVKIWEEGFGRGDVEDEDEDEGEEEGDWEGDVGGGKRSDGVLSDVSDEDDVGADESEEEKPKRRKKKRKRGKVKGESSGSGILKFKGMD